MPSAAVIARITDVGVAAAISPSGNALSLELTHIALGGTAFNPTGTETTLADRRETTTISAGSVGLNNQFVVTATFASRSGATYDAKSIAVYAGNPDSGGKLFALASAVGNVFVQRIGNGASYTVTLTVSLTGLPNGSVTVNVDSTAPAMAALLAAHVALAGAHPQYSTPIGTVQFVMARLAPPGWVVAAGQTLNRSAYPLLWAHVVSQGLAVTDAQWLAGQWGMFSSGNGTTTFRVPELRGEFIRAVDLGRGIDAGRNLGTKQDEEFRSHTHGNDWGKYLTHGFIQGGGDAVATGRTSPTQATGGSETRPRNIAYMAIIWTGLSTYTASNPVVQIPSPAPGAPPPGSPPPAPVPSPPPAAPAPSAPAGTPIAGFIGSPVFGTISSTAGVGSPTHTVNFTDQSTGSPTSWEWSFGDGGTSTAQNPSHEYTAPGLYDVNLRATNAIGNNLVQKFGYIIIGFDQGPTGGA